MVTLPALLGCAGDDGSPRGHTPDELDGTVTVLAASSMTEVLSELATAFEAEHPGVRIKMTFAGSSLLATEILEGVPADLFVAADEATFARVSEAGRTDGPEQTVATNALQIVVARGNPHAIRGLSDLHGGLIVALCRAEVPCGAYADQAFMAAGLEPPRAGRLDNVKAVLARVRLGEADAGVVYRTDVLNTPDVSGVDLAPAESIGATYPASVLADAANPHAARAFLQFLGGSAAQAILAAAGFGPP